MMNVSSHLTTTTFIRGLFLTLIATVALGLAGVTTEARATGASESSEAEVSRYFAFMDVSPDATLEQIRSRSVDEHESNRFITKYSRFIKRYNQNFVLGVPGGDQPDFTFLEEFAAPERIADDMKANIPKETTPTIDRVTWVHFTQRLVAGAPVVDRAEPYPTFKRAIFLRRNEGASSKTVTTELSGYAEDVAKQVKGMSRRVMLYTMLGDLRNYPSTHYPGSEVQRRRFDAIVMIWPKAGRIIPSSLKFGPPSNYRIVYTVNLESYYSSPID